MPKRVARELADDVLDRSGRDHRVGFAEQRRARRRGWAIPATPNVGSTRRVSCKNLENLWNPRNCANSSNSARENPFLIKGAFFRAPNISKFFLGRFGRFQ